MPKTTLKSNPNELVMASGVGESEMPAVAGYAPAIYGALSAIMDEIGAIEKEQRNKDQGFNFRGIDQAYNALHPLFAKHKVFTVPRVLDYTRNERITARGTVLTFTLSRVEYDFISGIDGSKITVGPIIGEGMDAGDKGANKSLAIAHKYALMQTFLVPTEKIDDPDAQAFDDVLPGDDELPTIDDLRTAREAMVADPQITDDQFLKKFFVSPNVTPDAPRIDDEQGATELTNVLISVARNMHSDSVASLADFWHKNKRTIDALDTRFPAEYQRLKQAFTAMKHNLMGDQS